MNPTTNPTNNDMQHCIDTCNSLLRGELSAIETYGRAVDRFADSPVADELRRLRTEHTESAVKLSHNVREMGGEPDTDSGAWGALTNAIQATADILGKGSAIESLQKGEELGLNGYEDALKDEGVMPSCKRMIADELLPRAQQNIAALEQLARTN